MGKINTNICYTYNDVTIMPSVVTYIEHRSECIPYDIDGMLPLFTAPMNTVVDKVNFDLFESNKIYAILPRTESLGDRISYSKSGKWAAYSLSEFSNIFCDNSNKIMSSGKIKVLIDVANGHMNAIFELARKSKEIYGDDIMLMGGNIANPSAYELYAKSGFYGVRVGIGTGAGCITSSNTSIHMPQATLVSQCRTLKENLSKEGWENDKLPKIIADGGIRNYSDVIKALALGADYVMVGSVFAKMVESAAPKTWNGVDHTIRIPSGTKFSDFTDIRQTENGCWEGKLNDKRVFLGSIKAVFYGMASREGQIALNGSKTKTSEGLKKTLEVEYSMKTWVENFSDYLRSAMSYTNSRTLNEFMENANLVVNSPNAVNAVNK